MTEPTLREVFEKDMANPKQTDDAFTEWSKNPTPDLLDKVVSGHRQTIDSAVSQFAGTNASPTVKQRARILAAKAVQNFDPTRGANLKTHIFNSLRPLQRMAPAIQDPLAPPERFRRQQLEIRNATEVLESQFGREPTDEEVADLTQLPVKRVVKVRQRMRSRIPASVYEEGGEDEDDGKDVATQSRDVYDDWTDAVYHDLGEIDKLVMAYRTGYRGYPILNNNAIARKLNVSPAAVSQRARLIQNKLDSFYGA